MSCGWTNFNAMITGIDESQRFHFVAFVCDNGIDQSGWWDVARLGYGKYKVFKEGEPWHIDVVGTKIKKEAME